MHCWSEGSNLDILHELVEQSSQGTFFSQGRRDILTIAIGTKEHLGRVRTTGFGVGVRQYFGSFPRPNTSAAPMTQEMMEQFSQQIRRQVTEDLRREWEQRWESMSTNHNVMNPNEDEDIETDISYRCKFFVEGVPHFVAIGRVYPGGSTMHTSIHTYNICICSLYH